MSTALISNASINNIRVIHKTTYGLDTQQKHSLKLLLAIILGKQFTGDVTVNLKNGGIIGLESHKSIDIEDRNSG